MWKKVHDSKDSVRYVKEEDGLTVLIEARENSDRSWEVVVKYTGNRLGYVETFSSKTKRDALEQINSLKKRTLGIEDLRRIEARKKSDVRVKLKRLFKDYSVEKWVFSIAGEGYDNHLYILFEDSVSMDLVLNRKYMLWKEKILGEIFSIFSLDEEETGVRLNIYYYDKLEKNQSDLNKGDLLKLLEIGFEE